MNERIKELAEQAEQYALDRANEGSDEDYDYAFDDDFREKFAELIVKECLDIIRCDAKNFRECDIKTDLVVVEEYNKTFKYIKQHFGVEE